MTTRGKLAVPVLAAALLVSCGGNLADRDPSGAQACQTLVEAVQSSNVEARLRASLEAGTQASQASTPAIRASAERLPTGAWMATTKGLTAACEAEGVDIPPAD